MCLSVATTFHVFFIFSQIGLSNVTLTMESCILGKKGGTKIFAKYLKLISKDIILYFPRRFTPLWRTLKDSLPSGSDYKQLMTDESYWLKIKQFAVLLVGWLFASKINKPPKHAHFDGHWGNKEAQATVNDVFKRYAKIFSLSFFSETQSSLVRGYCQSVQVTWAHGTHSSVSFVSM